MPRIVGQWVSWCPEFPFPHYDHRYPVARPLCDGAVDPATLFTTDDLFFGAYIIEPCPYADYDRPLRVSDFMPRDMV